MSEGTFIVADDHPLVRDGLKLMIQQLRPGTRFLEAGDADSLAHLLKAPQGARLALVDLNMPGMDRGARLHELSRMAPAIPIVAVSAMTSPDIVRRTIDIPSVRAFVPKSSGSERMLLAINTALQGGKLAPELPTVQTTSDDLQLSPRMQEIRALIRQGHSNKRIAGILHLSEGTVKNYVSEIFRVLNVTNRTQAAQYGDDLP
ncbi:MAG: response regulator transcription factor [Ramlibacter sp.]